MPEVRFLNPMGRLFRDKTKKAETNKYNIIKVVPERDEGE